MRSEARWAKRNACSLWAARAERAPDGTAYLHRLSAAATTRMKVAEDVHAALDRHALDRQIDRRADAQTLFRASYLVPRSRVAAFAERVDRLSAQHPELAIVCTGPWAPYSFAEEIT